MGRLGGGRGERGDILSIFSCYLAVSDPLITESRKEMNEIKPGTWWSKAGKSDGEEALSQLAKVLGELDSVRTAGSTEDFLI